MPLRFPRRFGASGDATELQYISALLQTTDDKKWRSDHTVTAADVQRYLISRHGFRLDPQQLQDDILHQLAGTARIKKPTIHASEEEEEEESQQQGSSSYQDDTNMSNSQHSRNSSKKKSSKKKKKFNARKVRYHGGTVHHHHTTGDDDEPPVMDLVQLTALLIIPELLQIRQKVEEDDHDDETAMENNKKRDENEKPTDDEEDECYSGPLALIEFVLEILREELAFITPEDELLRESAEINNSNNAGPDGTGAHPYVVTADDIARIKNSTTNMREDEQEQLQASSAPGDDDDNDDKPQTKRRRTHDTSILLAAAHKRPIRLNRRVLLQLLRAVGEDPAHWTNDDLYEMLELAHLDKSIPLTADSDFELDAKALLKAITDDVAIYPVDRVNALSTHYNDVMSTVGDHLNNNLDDDDDDDGDIPFTRTAVVQDDEEEGRRHSSSSPGQQDQPKGVFRHPGAEVIRMRSFRIQNEFRPSLTLGTSHERIFTLASLDQAADTQRSRLWACVSWLTLVVVYVAFFMGNYEEDFDHQTSLPNLDCDNATESYGLSKFGCETVNGIVQWLQVFLELSVIGTAFMILSQLGNNVYATEKQQRRWVTTLYSLLGIATVTFTCILSYFYELETNLFNTEGERSMAHMCAFGIGLILILLQVIELARLYLPLERYPLLADYFVSGALKREQITKRSACFKTERLLINALGCYLGDDFDRRQEDGDADSDDNEEDQPSNSNIDESPVDGGDDVFRNPRAPLMDRVSALVHCISCRRRADAAAGIVGGGGGLHAQALMHYHDNIDATEMTGSVCFFWRDLFSSRSLITEEGIWLSSRLLTANLVQWVIAVVVIPALFFVFYELNDDDTNTEELQQEHNIEEVHVVAAVFVGGVAALFVSWLTALIYIPSAMSTTLQMRSGYLGSTFEQRFQLFRKSPDRATALFGAALWGSLLSAALAWGIFGGIIFVFLWTEIREEVMVVLSSVIGFTTTFVLKWLLLKVFRKVWFTGLYRKRPGAANIMHLVLECWNLGLSSGFMLLRVVRLVLTAIFYVGRIDTPFLAEGVGVIFNSPLDSYPMAFRRDLIIHEAHRHPWVERLGAMYMMKLQHGRNFGRRGGAAWRTVFLLALLPWLRKHRQLPPATLVDAERDGNDDDDDVYGLDSLKGRSASHRFSRRKAVVMAQENHDPRTRLMVENKKLVAENHALRRQVMEMANILSRERGGTWHGLAPNTKAGRSVTLN